jgi:hypothetical protein
MSSLQQNTSVEAVSKGQLWTGRVLSGIAVLFLTMDTGFKLVAPAAMAAEATAQLGYPAHLLPIIGWIEAVLLVLYLIPRTSVFGAALDWVSWRRRRHALPHRQSAVHPPVVPDLHRHAAVARAVAARSAAAAGSAAVVGAPTRSAAAVYSLCDRRRFPGPGPGAGRYGGIRPHGPPGFPRERQDFRDASGEHGIRLRHVGAGRAAGIPSHPPEDVHARERRLGASGLDDGAFGRRQTGGGPERHCHGMGARALIAATQARNSQEAIARAAQSTTAG